jgi:predicted phage gp36 major capsid-like protein
VRTTVLLAEAQTLSGWRAPAPKQSIAATRFMNAILAMHPNLIDAFYRFVASGSTSEPEIFWQGRNGTLLGKQVLEWSTVQTSLTTTGQRLAILGDWSGFTIVDRLGAQIELIPHLFGATNHFPRGAARHLANLAIFVGCYQAERAALDLLRIAS